MFTDDSDYVVEQYIKPNKVRVPLINDERADLLGNFDDDGDKFKRKGAKSKQIPTVSEENPFDDADADADADADDNVLDDSNNDNDGVNTEDRSNAESNDTEPNEAESIIIKTTEKYQKNQKKKVNKNFEKRLELSDEQIKALIRGCSKKDRYVLYVTNLNYSTTRETLTDLFSGAGPVKSVRVPKVRRNAFAFVEMSDLNGFKAALALHNRTLDNYTIKVQISEAGKKKSANKKNILKQKNRKLAEMRNETKKFQRSGKGYDKTIKKEINQQKIQQNRRLAKKQAKKHV